MRNVTFSPGDQYEGIKDYLIVHKKVSDFEGITMKTLNLVFHPRVKGNVLVFIKVLVVFL